MNLVIVESPTKAKTITRYLGKDYLVLSSFGHIRDLPKNKLGVDVKKGYKPDYAIPPKSNKALKAIKTATNKKNIEKVILASDEDREGEAIAFHLKHIIQKYNPKLKFERITFHEITKTALQKALKNPRDIDLDLFNAQQARRVLDRLVGYNLSPLLWRKIRYGLSAGRVQSVALRLVVEREREREKFKEEEYWTVQAFACKKDLSPLPEIAEDLKDKKKKDLLTLNPDIIVADLKEVNGKKLSKLAIKNKSEAEKIKKELEKTKLEVLDITKKETRRYPAPPFKTSTLQREAANKLGFSAKQTMMVAQKLYEGIKLEKGNTGLITYMRTDSLNVAESALKKAKEVILKNYGEKYILPEPRRYANKTKGAQEAHEAIRPTFPEKTPESLQKFLAPEQLKLYRLIWQKFVASQMKEAVFDKIIVQIKAGDFGLEAQGSQLKFDGFLKIYGPSLQIQEALLPELKKDEKLNLLKIAQEQHFTQPPARYNDASLIKTLEDNGIGRPSTYAPTLATIVSRGYVEKDEKKQYVPQEIGFLVNDLMVENFPKIVDYEFTAQMEGDLDSIAVGKKDWVKTIDNFYQPFSADIKEKDKTIQKYQKEISKACPQCGKTLVEKFGRFGKFYACSGFPDCKYTEDPKQKEMEKIQKEAGQMKCEKCGNPMELKKGRFGMFWGCTNYPECKNLKKYENSSGVKCPLCQKGEIVEKRSRKGIFWACNNYPKCKNAMTTKPTGEKCEACGGLMIENPRTGGTKCANKECVTNKRN